MCVHVPALPRLVSGSGARTSWFRDSTHLAEVLPSRTSGPTACNQVQVRVGCSPRGARGVLPRRHVPSPRARRSALGGLLQPRPSPSATPGGPDGGSPRGRRRPQGDHLGCCLWSAAGPPAREPRAAGRFLAWPPPRPLPAVGPGRGRAVGPRCSARGGGSGPPAASHLPTGKPPRRRLQTGPRP